MSGNPAVKRPHYGLFALASTVYTVGIVAFSIWSYAQQRTNILAQVDQSLINATHATEQILGDIFLACAVEIDSPSDLSSAGNKSNLNRFAENCSYDLLAAISCKNGELRALITGGTADREKSGGPSCIRTQVRTHLESDIQQLAGIGMEATRLKTVELEQCGQMHIAIRYRPLSGNTGYAILVARSTQEVNLLINRLAMRTVGVGILLYCMAFPLIVLYNFARARALRETAELHERLREDYIKLKERESELEDAIHDLERFNAVTLGREGRIIELKAEVNTLLEQMNQHKRYNVDHMD